MIRKKAKGKKAAKKAGKKKGTSTTRRHRKKELNPVGTWKDVAALVESHARKLTSAVIQEGEKKGQVSPVKFLFEMAKIGPAPPGMEASEEEESLAKTLFRTLNLPIVPLPTEQDEEDTVVIPANASAPAEEEKEEDKSADSEKVGV